MNVLITCPPMLRLIDRFRPVFDEKGINITTPDVIQTLSVAELKEIVPQHEGWIIGDDPATREVFEAGRSGRLRAAVKWGIGVDNVDFLACRDLGIPITNTPNMFGAEVADIAMGYIIGLARQTFMIDRGVRAGGWPKPAGVSLSGKTVALVGFGDIGRQTAKRLLAADMNVIAYDPGYQSMAGLERVESAPWPSRLYEADFIVITCALTPSSYHLLNSAALSACKDGVRVINVARGPIIDQPALEAAIAEGRVHSAALDVFEVEPLPENSPLRLNDRCIFGSHNASNTVDAVERTSHLAIEKLCSFLGV